VVILFILLITFLCIFVQVETRRITISDDEDDQVQGAIAASLDFCSCQWTEDQDEVILTVERYCC